jgi:hypothetical protein
VFLTTGGIFIDIGVDGAVLTVFRDGNAYG